mmetsp:Transcript_17031/g.41805  ORF Transcript_17031/g.41805 Transcript_17031/m.41805 type:complete len:231 (-) Transcript_17031:869-1561(-)
MAFLLWTSLFLSLRLRFRSLRFAKDSISNFAELNSWAPSSARPISFGTPRTSSNGLCMLISRLFRYAFSASDTKCLPASVPEPVPWFVSSDSSFSLPPERPLFFTPAVPSPPNTFWANWYSGEHSPTRQNSLSRSPATTLRALPESLRQEDAARRGPGRVIVLLLLSTVPSEAPRALPPPSLISSIAREKRSAVSCISSSLSIERAVFRSAVSFRTSPGDILSSLSWARS